MQNVALLLWQHQLALPIAFGTADLLLAQQYRSAITTTTDRPLAATEPFQLKRVAVEQLLLDDWFGIAISNMPEPVGGIVADLVRKASVFLPRRSSPPRSPSNSPAGC